MYAGYAWLTNNLAPGGAQYRILLVVGMVGFFTMALATPHAFGADGLAFGLGYLLVVVLHSTVFALASDRRTVRAILRVAPTNLLSALLVVAAGFVEGVADAVLWPLAVVVAVAGPLVTGISGFLVEPAHFVERHGLIVIVVLGESVVALGASVQSGHLGPGTVVICALGLLLAVALWWVYFDADESRAEAALEEAPEDRRAPLALASFGFAFVPLLLGVVLVAAGLEESVPSPWRAAHWPAPALLAGGVALYLAGEAAFRLVLGIRPVASRFVAAGVAAAVTALGPVLPAAALIALLAAVLAVLLVGEARARAGSTPAARSQAEPELT
jgi:low temperature requirement protein LtrA